MDVTQPLRPVVQFPGGERIRTLAIMGVAAIAIALTVFVVDTITSPGVTTVELTGDTSGPRPVVGAVPPDFSAVTVDGETFRLADLAGRPIWLTFGASWCADCRAEAPDLQATYEAHAPAGLAVVSIWIEEGDADVRAYAGRVGLTFTKIADPSTALASRYQTYGLPTHFFIAPDGTIREIRIGGLPRDDMNRLVEGILQ